MPAHCQILKDYDRRRGREQNANNIVVIRVFYSSHDQTVNALTVPKQKLSSSNHNNEPRKQKWFVLFSRSSPTVYNLTIAYGMNTTNFSLTWHITETVLRLLRLRHHFRLGVQFGSRRPARSCAYTFSLLSTTPTTTTPLSRRSFRIEKKLCT